MRNECRVPITSLPSCHASSLTVDCVCLCTTVGGVGGGRKKKKTQQGEFVCVSVCVRVPDCDCVSSNLRGQLLSINHNERRESCFIFIITINMVRAGGRIEQVSRRRGSGGGARNIQEHKVVVLWLWAFSFVLGSYSKRWRTGTPSRGKQ